MAFLITKKMIFGFQILDVFSLFSLLKVVVRNKNEKFFSACYDRDFRVGSNGPFPAFLR